MASVPKQYFLIFAIFLAIAFGGGVQYGKYIASGSENALAMEKVSSSQTEDSQTTDPLSVVEDSSDASVANVASQQEEGLSTPESSGESSASKTESANHVSQVNGKININQADTSLLETLPGIGPVKAQAIVDYRKTKGGFSSIADITNVSGIGEKTYEKIKEQICVD